MTVRPERRRRLLSHLGAATAVVLLAGACTTSGSDAAVTVTSRVEVTVGDAAVGEPAAQQTVPATTPVAAGSIVVVEPGEAPAASSDPAPAGSSSAQSSGAVQSSGAPQRSTAASGSNAPTTPKTTVKTTAKTTAKPPKPAPKPVEIFTSPGRGAAAVNPLGKISVTAQGGSLLWVKVINPEGKIVKQATMATGQKVWSWMPELGFSRKYVVRTAAKSTAGAIRTGESTFTTLAAKTQISASVFPTNGMKVGVAQPIVIRFSSPISGDHRRAVEKMIRIDRTAGQPGAFRWFSNTELHWRPKGYWAAGTTVSVSTNIYGERLSAGKYGQADGRTRFTVGRRVTSIVDATTHHMSVYRDFTLIKRIPVSLGNDKYPTYNGTHLVTDKHKTYTMDSSTWGLTGVGAYVTKVKWATRISNSGEFVHGAPWSEYAQGNTNVSHGCINMTDANAQWFLELALPGDPVTVRNSVGPKLKSYDGFGDWTIPWSKY